MLSKKTGSIFVGRKLEHRPLPSIRAIVIFRKRECEKIEHNLEIFAPILVIGHPTLKLTSENVTVVQQVG